MAERRFEGKVALVTGGNSGIGLAVATALVREGAKVILSGRNEATVAAAAKALGLAATGVAADTGRIEGIERVVATAREFGGGRLDVLFCNAGIGAFGPIATITEQKWDEVMNVNLKGVYFTVQEGPAADDERRHDRPQRIGRGRQGRPGTPIYAASKAAVRSLGRSPRRRAGGGRHPRQRRQPGADRNADLRQGGHEREADRRPQGRLLGLQPDEALRHAGGGGRDGPRLGRRRPTSPAWTCWSTGGVGASERARRLPHRQVPSGSLWTSRPSRSRITRITRKRPTTSLPWR